MSHTPFSNPKPLRTVHARLELDSGPEDAVVAAYVHGYSPNRRTHLWAEAALWTPEDSDQRVEPADWIHHILLCSLQDRPNTQERLLFSLTGGLGQQGTLF